MDEQVLTREEKRKKEEERARRLTGTATKNGFRITVSTKPTPGELDFTKALRRSLET